MGGYELSCDNQSENPADGHLVFPSYRSKKGLRVSEQEARFAFVEALCREPLRYSIETPTSVMSRIICRKKS